MTTSWLIIFLVIGLFTPGIMLLIRYFRSSIQLRIDRNNHDNEFEFFLQKIYSAEKELKAQRDLIKADITHIQEIGKIAQKINQLQQKP